MRSLPLWISLGLTGALAVSCSKNESKSGSEEPAEGSAIVISGSLAVTGESTSLRQSTVALTDLSVYCVSFSVPPVAGTGAVAADGAFSLSLEAFNVSVGCFINHGENVLGTIVFTDPTKKDLSGSEKSSDRLAFGGNAALGAITLDLATGKAVVDVTKIQTTVKDTNVTAATSFDFTGNYVVSSSDIAIPAGYGTVCTQAQQSGGDSKDECRGPAEGEKLFFKRIAGKDPVDSSDKYAAMIWSSETAFKACGEKLGISFADAIAHGIDLSASGVGEGDLTWTAGLVDGWKDTVNATATWPMNHMEHVDDFNGYPGTKQFFTKYRTCTEGQLCGPGQGTVVNTSGFSFWANTKETGCVDATGKPFQPEPNDYQDMTCEYTALTGGLSKNVCKKGTTFTCTHIGGNFKSDGSALTNAFIDQADYTVYVAQGGKCSSITGTTPEAQLAQLRCYAEYMHRNESEDENVCRRDVRTNWAAKTPAEFLMGGDGPQRARGQHVFELFDYTSATSGSLRSESREFRGINFNNNWVDCEVMDSFSLALTKIGDTSDLLVEMIQKETNISSKPACIAEFGEGRQGKFMFRLVKQ